RGLLSVAIDLTYGLEALHGAGIVHGDLKPRNLLVVPSEDGELPTVRLLDFLGDPTHGGTIGYAAPEVLAGRPATSTSDLYGLGPTLQHLSVGAPPSPHDDAKPGGRPQRPEPVSAAELEESGTPPGLVSLVLRLLAIDPQERPREAREVRHELESLDPSAVRP